MSRPKKKARGFASRQRRRKQTPHRRAGVARADSRMYHTALNSRLTSGWAQSTTSADSELHTSLTSLRNRSRALVRDAAYAKRAKVVVTNNVIGSGIGLQAQVMSSRDTMREDINDAIESAFREWCAADSCHTGGALHFSDFERALMGQIFEAGEVFVRKHFRTFGASRIPFALELIEAERVPHGSTSDHVPGPIAAGATVKMGIEVDVFHRAIAYWIRRRHPGETRTQGGEIDLIERVPAEQVWHLRLVDRWPQTRGEPWLHAVARKLNDMDGYSEAEIVAARGGAMYLGAIESTDQDTPLAETKPDGTEEFPLEVGMMKKLGPNEKLNFHSPTRPNTALDPFMRYMLREVAAGVGVSYESLSRDYSQSNYSSSRLALLDDRDLWRMLQQWFIRNFRLPLHKTWLQSAVLSGAVAGVRLEEYGSNPLKYEKVLFKPRGWGWVDPAKEVAAYQAAVEDGFTTVTDVIAASGGGQDLEDVLRTRARELKLMEQMGLKFVTSPEVYAPATPAPAPAPGGPEPEDPDAEDPEDSDAEDPEDPDDRGRVGTRGAARIVAIKG